MIVLDTNVISESMRGPRADAAVRAWVTRLPTRPVTTVINRAEILSGIAMLPEGRRRDEVLDAADGVLSGMGVCLPLTEECAEHYADIVAVRRRAGRPIASMDALIAAIVRVSGSRLATRDVDDFGGLGLDLVNPWDSGHPVS